MEPTNNPTAAEAVVYSSDDPALIDSCSLVLEACNIDHQLTMNSDGTAAITVAPEKRAEAVHQIECFLHENKDWPPAPVDARKKTISRRPPTILIIGALALFFLITGSWHYDNPWFVNGASDADAVLQDGEWYRLITALSLHADLAHLAGNCLIGGFLLHFYLQISGTGLGLLTILGAASIGNYVNVLVHGGDHVSVGFSTAVFATIGLLSSHQLIEQRQPFGIRTLVPFMAGAALLGMLGSSGGRTDVGAHLFGLISGMAVGILLCFEPVRSLRNSSFFQTISFLVTVLTLLLCWNMALD